MYIYFIHDGKTISLERAEIMDIILINLKSLININLKKFRFSKGNFNEIKDEIDKK